MSPQAKSGLFLSFGVCIFGFADNLMLFITDQVSVGQFHFNRSLIACVLVFLLAFLKNESVLPVRWLPVLLRTLFNTIAMLLYFAVLPMMPIAEAGAGLFTSPIFVLLFSYFFFNIKISSVQIFAFALGLIGVILVFGTNFSKFTVYHSLPVLAGACYAIGVILTNRYCSQESPLALVFSFLVTIGVLGFGLTSWFTLFPADTANLADAPFLFSGWRTVNVFYWWIMMIVGLGGATAIYLMIIAYQIGNPTFSAIYEYVYLIAAGFFSWYIWGTLPGYLSFFGIIAIVIAGLMISLHSLNIDKG